MPSHAPEIMVESIQTSTGDASIGTGATAIVTVPISTSQRGSGLEELSRRGILCPAHGHTGHCLVFGKWHDNPCHERGTLVATALLGLSMINQTPIPQVQAFN